MLWLLYMHVVYSLESRSKTVSHLITVFKPKLFTFVVLVVVTMLGFCFALFVCIVCCVLFCFVVGFWCSDVLGAFISWDCGGIALKFHSSVTPWGQDAFLQLLQPHHVPSDKTIR